jgi:hypothetical protein
MLILFGEKTITFTEDLGDFNCPICKEKKSLSKVVDRNYFTVFFIRLIPLGTTAEYMQCSNCGHAFPSLSATEPTYFEPLKSLLAYLLVGYGLIDGVDTAKNIFRSITSTEVSVSDLQKIISQIQQNNHLSSNLKQVANKLSWLDKSLIIEAAFLLVYTARPIKYEERLQINLLASSIGIGIEGVNAIISNLKSQEYKGFQGMQMNVDT